MSTPKTLISLEDLSEERRAWERDGARVAFVPTMGALHDGHASLVRQAKTLADRVLVSIFVNPTQFGPKEDFSRYPRTLAADMTVLSAAGADAVFVPNASTIYPEGFQTYVHNKKTALDLDGVSRPGHFEGVLTVVLKLLLMTCPHVAIFGKKDYQQWRLISRMVADLSVPVEIVGAETLREPDGLAMSSRNRYLTSEERPRAVSLSKGLNAAREAVKAGAKSIDAVVAAFVKQVEDVPGLELEYAEVRRKGDLAVWDAEAFGSLTGAVLLIAARVGTTRLIDNMELG